MIVLEQEHRIIACLHSAVVQLHCLVFVLLFQSVTVAVAIRVPGNHDYVNDGPDSAAATCQEHQNSSDDISGIETMHAEAADKNAQQQCD